MTNPAIFSEQVRVLLQSHFQQLHEGSGISIDVIKERGYRSILYKAELEKYGFTEYQRRVPGLLVPICGVDGKVAGHQFKPDTPRNDKRGRKTKYETPKGATNRIDCPPRCQKLLADPAVPLWITEGVKKADCLMSHGECAIDVTGIWNWRGKNKYGGMTVLSDFDSIAFNGRLVYLVPDSDVITNTAVKSSVTMLGTFLARRNARVLVAIPKSSVKGSKAGVDDFIVAGHSVDELKSLAVNFEGIADEEKNVIFRSYFLLDNQLYLEVRKHNGDYAFAHLDNQGKMKFTLEIPDKGRIIRPRRLPEVEGKIINIVGLPDEGMALCQLRNSPDLYARLKAHIGRYVDLLPLDLDLSVFYILFTWFYQKVDTVGYLRFIADTGKGKSRAQKTVGDLCFYPVFASGASSFSGIGRLNDRWKGTLIVDEADINGDKEHQFIKYLNLGFERDKYYVLSDKQNPRFQEYFDPFSPKVLAMRQPFRDNATEGRLLSISPHETTNTDIPIILPPAYFNEAQQLRNELAIFTLYNWDKVDGNNMWSFTDSQVEPRLKQLAMPLSIIFQLWPESSHRFEEYLLRRQAEIKKTRSFSWEGSLVNLVVSIAAGDLSLKEEFADYYLTEDTPEAITPTMVARQMKTSTKSVTQGLRSVGFEVEWRRVAKKRTRAYCIPDTQTWQEIIQRYYYSDESDMGEIIEMPEVLKSSKYVDRVLETVPSVPSVPIAIGTGQPGTNGTDGTLPNTPPVEVNLQSVPKSGIMDLTEEEKWEEL